MAWITPKTNFAPGNVLTADQMNDIGNNLVSLRGDFASSRYTTGTLTLNSTTWANVGGPADLVLAASTGDIIECNISLAIGQENVSLWLDVVTIVGTTVTNSFASNGAVNASGEGIAAWTSVAGRFERPSGSFYYKLVSGDISSSTVTVRLRYRQDAATNRSVFASSNLPAVFFARNHGPVEI